MKVSLAAWLGMVCLTTILASSATSAQTADARSAMERCVDGVLSRMVHAGTSEAKVGQAVVSHCDGPLRAALASAIKTGEAFICSVESCIGIARERAASEAISAYRERLAQSAGRNSKSPRTASR